MSKGYAVYPLMKQPRETVIDEALIRDCVFLPHSVTTDEERMQIVSNRHEALFRKKTMDHIRDMDLRNVATLLLSYRRIGLISNLYGLNNLTKLSLDNNHITKIENLHHLTKLQTLDLSYNQITVIEGLDTLVELDSLSLYCNSITAVSGLDNLKILTALSLGKNPIESLDETATYLHNLRQLRVLTLKDCRVAAAQQYRPRLLAFIPTIRFLDGRAIRPAEIAQAREDQRENLLSIDEQDELRAADDKATAERQSATKEYERYNCPHEGTLYDELLHIAPDGRNMLEVVRSDIVISATKEILDRNQNDFNDRAKELADAMKAVRARRDADEAAYTAAVTRYSQQNLATSRELIRAFEKRIKTVFRIGVQPRVDLEAGTGEALQQLQNEVFELQSDLVEKEADMYDTNEALNSATLSKWKTDGVDVLLQSAFESLYKLEGDFQVALRQAFDAVHDHRQKKDRSADEDFYFATGRDAGIATLIENKEDYQKLLADWFEARRKRLEEKEMTHLKAEERLLAERASDVARREQERHRNRLSEITEYVEQMDDLIESV